VSTPTVNSNLRSGLRVKLTIVALYTVEFGIRRCRQISR
jgi:hypothetical protein